MEIVGHEFGIAVYRTCTALKPVGP